MAVDFIGKNCKLLKPIRDHGGKNRYHEENPLIKREVINLDRIMYLIAWIDGATTFLFPDEFEVI